MMREAKAIERRLRRRVRPIVYSSPALWLEYKKARRAGRRSLVSILLVVFVCCTGGPMLFGVVPVMTALILERSGGLDFMVTAFCLWSVGAQFIAADCVLRTIWLSPEAKLFLHLPISDSAIVRLALRMTVGTSALWFLIGAWPFGFVAWRLKLSLVQWLIALVFCLGQWLVIVASGIVLAYHRPKSWYLRAGAILMFAPFFLLFAVARANPQTLADSLYIATPAGWMAAAWMRGWLSGSLWGWLGLFRLLLSMYLLARLCLWIDAKGYFDLTSASPSALQLKHEVNRVRRHNRSELRRRFGRFWWLPRYMAEARTIQ